MSHCPTADPYCAYLSDLFNLGAPFAYERSTLAGREDQAQRHRGFASHRAVYHAGVYVLK